MYSQRPAFALADYHEIVDITDKDATLRVASRYKIDGILCDTTDVGVPTAAYVAEKLGLAGMGYDTSVNFTNKGRMRQITDRAGLTVPAYRLVHSESDLDRASADLGFPLIVKPVDNQSGRGVRRVVTVPDLFDAYTHARGNSRQGTVLVESCLAGREIIVDGFLINGVVTILGIAGKTPNEDVSTIASRITYGCDFSRHTMDQIERANRRTLAAMGLHTGIFHAEYLLTSDGAVPIDIAARGGGCKIYTHVIPHISGVNVNKAMVQFAMGENFAIEPDETRRAANIEFFQLPHGVIADIEGIDDANRQPGIVAMHCNVAIGDRIDRLSNKDDRPGYLVAVADTSQEAINLSIAAKSRIRIRMTDNPQHSQATNGEST
jgi:carbamoyl-phosphate synthase large subunit